MGAELFGVLVLFSALFANVSFTEGDIHIAIYSLFFGCFFLGCSIASLRIASKYKEELDKLNKKYPEILKQNSAIN